MSDLLNRQAFFIRERVAIIRLSDTYDILDPETQAQIGLVKESSPVWVKLLRFVVNKSMLPTVLQVSEGTDPEQPGPVLFSIERGFSFLRPQVFVLDGEGRALGSLKSKLFSLGGAFFVLDPAGQEVAFLQGDWKGWNFKFTDANKNEIGAITKKWAGIGKELFTSADNYIITLNGQPDQSKAALLLAAGLAVDTVLKENN